jgi:hypothetical protein
MAAAPPAALPLAEAWAPAVLASETSTDAATASDAPHRAARPLPGGAEPLLANGAACAAPSALDPSSSAEPDAASPPGKAAAAAGSPAGSPAAAAAAAAAPAAAGPQYKRGRGRSFFRGGPRRGAVCQVPDCDRPLHKLRDYYKRYKICPHHLELPAMVVEGQSIRFCQQCGRFQLTVEFEGDRRSCRRKLEKHNERRRVRADGGSDSEPESSGSPGKARRTVGAAPRRLAAAGGGAAFAGHGGYGLPAAHGGAGDAGVDLAAMLRSLAADPELRAALEPRMGAGLDALAAGAAGMPAGRAPAADRAAAFDPQTAQLAALQAQLGRQMEARDAAQRQQLHEMRLHVAEAAAQRQQQQQQQAPFFGGAGAALGPLLQAAALASGGAGVGAFGGQLAPARAPDPAPVDELAAAVAALQRLSAPAAPPPPPPSQHALSAAAIQQLLAGAPGDAAVAGLALQLVSRLAQAAAAPPDPQERLVTLALKIQGATPERDPLLLAPLAAALAKRPALGEAALRPGCVHATAAALLRPAEEAALRADLAAAARRALAAASPAGAPRGVVLAQLQSAAAPAAAVLADGRLAMLLDLSADDGALLPRPAAVAPLAATPGFEGPFLVAGTRLDAVRDGLHARAAGALPTLELLGGGEGGAASWLRFRAPGGLPLGATAVEVQRGALVGAPLAVAVLDDAAAAAELRGLERDAAGVADVADFVFKVGAVARHLAPGAPAAEPATAAAVAAAAQEAAAVALLRGWPALLRLVLPAVAAAEPGEPGAAIAAVGARLGAPGACPLAAAAATGDSRLVAALGEWGAAAGHAWEAGWVAAEGGAAAGAPGGPPGLAPHHVAALLADPLPVAAALNALPRGREGWAACGAGGAAPSALSVATELGRVELLRALEAGSVLGAGAALGAALKRRAAAGSPPPSARAAGDVSPASWSTVSSSGAGEAETTAEAEAAAARGAGAGAGAAPGAEAPARAAPSLGARALLAAPFALQAVLLLGQPAAALAPAEGWAVAVALAVLAAAAAADARGRATRRRTFALAAAALALPGAPASGGALALVAWAACGAALVRAPSARRAGALGGSFSLASLAAPGAVAARGGLAAAAGAAASRAATALCLPLAAFHLAAGALAAPPRRRAVAAPKAAAAAP